MSAALIVLSIVGVTAGAPTRVALPRWSSPPALATAADALVEQAALELSRWPGWVVVSEAEIQLLVAHERDRHDLAACQGEGACLAKLSAAVEAEKLLTGRLDRLGEGWLLTLSWSDTGTRTRARGESLYAESERELSEALPATLARLTGQVDPLPVARAASSATIAAGSRLALLELAGYDARAELAESLSPLVALEIKRAGFDVVSRDEVRALLHYEADKQVIGRRSDPAALAEIGGALGVDYLVAGGVGRIGTRSVVYLKLMSVRGAAVVARVSEGFEGPEAQLAPAIRVAVRALLGLPGAGLGALDVVTEEVGRASLDARATPLPSRFEAVETGRHRLRVEAEGYLPLEHDVYVEAGQTTRVRPALIAAEVPWYERWWVWTAVGAAVVAGVGVGVIAVSSRAPDLGGLHGAIDVR